MFKLILHKQAWKTYTKLNDKTARRLNKAIDELKSNPFSGKDVKKLKGELEGRYRLRVGELRIVYRVEAEEELIIVESIGGRGDVYKF